MALRIHKKKVATLKPKRVILDVPPIQEATVRKIQEAAVPHIQEAGTNTHQIQEVISNVRQISPTRFDKLMAESMGIIEQNRILLDNYYVDVRWRINGVSSFENVIDTPSMKSTEENKIVISKPFSTEILSNLPLQNRVSDTYKRTLDEKEIRLRKILTEDISKPAPLKRKHQTVIEVNPRLIPKKKKRTEVSHIIVF